MSVRSASSDRPGTGAIEQGGETNSARSALQSNVGPERAPQSADQGDPFARGCGAPSNRLAPVPPTTSPTDTAGGAADERTKPAKPSIRTTSDAKPLRRGEMLTLRHDGGFSSQARYESCLRDLAQVMIIGSGVYQIALKTRGKRTAGRCTHPKMRSFRVDDGTLERLRASAREEAENRSRWLKGRGL